MQDRDGIYLNRIWVAPPDAIATNYVGNDLTKPASLQTSYSSQFTLPDTVAVRKLTENAEQLDSGSRYPYKLIPAYVIDGGEYTFYGVARLTDFSDGWKASLYEEKRDIFVRLDRSIRTADLSRFNHDWTLENINARSNSTDGVFYPLVDYGLLSANNLPMDTMFPAVFAHTVVRQMLKEEGYSIVGDLPKDDLFKRIGIPFSEQEGTSRDQKFVDDRKARVTQNNPEYSVRRGPFGTGRIIDRIQPFDIDNQPAETWTQGILKNYNTATHEYIPDTAMRLKVEAFQMFKCRVTTGAVEATLQIVVNGQNIHEVRFGGGSPYNLTYQSKDSLSLNKTISVNAGDRVQIWFFAQRQTKIGDYAFTLYNDPASSWVAFTPDQTLHTGDVWPVSRNLPDITGTALMIDLAHIMGGTWVPDARRREIKFVGLTQTVENTKNAVDWSNRLDTDTLKLPGWSPILPGYAQSNFLKWKETDETKSLDKSLNYGDGIISVNVDTLDTKTDLFELSFAASTLSTSEVSGYGNPLLIKTRTVTGGGSSETTINKQTTTPRLILVSIDGEVVPVASKRLNKDGVTTEDVIVKLRPCWFGPRPNVAMNNKTAFSLCFSPVPNMKGEVCLIPRNYTGLIRVLSRMRVLNTGIKLSPEDIASLDFGRPIRLKRVALGSSLVLSDGFYYLNAINNYRSNSPCSTTLIAFS